MKSKIKNSKSRPWYWVTHGGGKFQFHSRTENMDYTICHMTGREALRLWLGLTWQLLAGAAESCLYWYVEAVRSATE